MTSKANTRSWFNIFRDYPALPGMSEGLVREYTFLIDDALHELWELGRNLILLWGAGQAQHEGSGSCGIYRISEFAQEAPSDGDLKSRR